MSNTFLFTKQMGVSNLYNISIGTSLFYVGIKKWEWWLHPSHLQAHGLFSSCRLKTEIFDKQIKEAAIVYNII